MRRRFFLGCMASSVPWAYGAQAAKGRVPSTELPKSEPGESIPHYLNRVRGKWDQETYRKILGDANEFKEGDALIGVAAANDDERHTARSLLENTSIGTLRSHPPFEDELYRWMEKHLHESQDAPQDDRTLHQLRHQLLHEDPRSISKAMSSWNSDIIACLVKILSNDELIRIGQSIFNPLPGSRIGAKGYLGARVQPNSPTDHPDDIRWQVFDAFAYGVGDVLVGTNPVSSDPDSVAAIERALQDILKTFQIDHLMPHCVLSHIDIQKEVEKKEPGITELWFQSIAGNDAANRTFDLTLDKMIAHTLDRASHRFGLYFETGQGADFTNGHGHGCDMVLHESRKYGMARALTHLIRKSRQSQGLSPDVWLHVNDVAGFIGPEVFRTKEQLVRCCLEDIVMGKLHGLTLGLDVCSTLHMDINLEDLDWCLEQIAPANPAYLMALPTKIDPMLGYLTTSYQDHVRLREKFGFRVNDGMRSFFQAIDIVDASGSPTSHFGDPTWVYYQYCLRKGDTRSLDVIVKEGRALLAQIRERGVFIAEGYDRAPSRMEPELKKQTEQIYSDAKICIWKEWEKSFVNSLPAAIQVHSQSSDRNDYILHPTSGESLSEASQERIRGLRGSTQNSEFVIVVSEGLNALAAMEPGHLTPLVDALKNGLSKAGKQVFDSLIVVHAGRVRAGYRIGELLFQGLEGNRTMVHIIGERPGTGHRTLSVYMTTASGADWSTPGKIDHNLTRVVSGIAHTALKPERAAVDCLKVLLS